MWHHFTNLLSRSWGNMVMATGTTTLGFLVWTVALAIVSWAATVAAKAKEIRASDQHPILTAIRTSFWAAVFSAGGTAILTIVLLCVFVVRTVYVDHQDLAKAVHDLRSSNATLSVRTSAAEGERDTLRQENKQLHKRLPSPTDKVFANLIDASRKALIACKPGLTESCVSSRRTWEGRVETELGKINPSYLAEWRSWKVQQQSGVPFAEVTGEVQLLMGFLGHLK